MVDSLSPKSITSPPSSIVGASLHRHPSFSLTLLFLSFYVHLTSIFPPLAPSLASFCIVFPVSKPPHHLLHCPCQASVAAAVVADEVEDCRRREITVLRGGFHPLQCNVLFHTQL
ncbi:hypothetical protein PIB30_020460 [Stylosanthes scabra]|uniref:Uncharacterized protein n=1 Tax=Stylosanthes scabra TaxID=79078 RepID=A0ABU6V7K4_9FABA|nr:hypothetical protein [Stylosanthes scabra]